MNQGRYSSLNKKIIRRNNGNFFFNNNQIMSKENDKAAINDPKEKD